ncbi:MAG: molybdopterin cofactor-binding domain-containing protein [Bryobacteraceae bacterium]
MNENFEPERYELREAPAWEFAPTRREFVEVLGAGLLLTVAASAQRGGGGARPALAARLHLGEDGVVTVLTGKVEVGQGARTQIAMATAEELRLPLERVRVTMADTDVVPNDGITAGSRTTPATIPPVRRACAAARKLLEASGKRDFGELAKSGEFAAAGARPPDDVEVTAVKEWRLLGQGRHRVDGRAIVTGAHHFPADITRPGMLYGAVLRAPAYNATLTAVDPDAARKAGAVAVREGAFVACAAPTSHRARKALAAIAATAQWDRKEHVPSSALFEHLKNTGGNPRTQMRGSLDEALAASARRVKASFRVPYIQHVPMEPRAAVADWSGDKLTVWTGTQNPFGVRDQLAQAFHIAAEKIRVIVPDTGGGFGGKHTGEVAIEAARIAREAGKPVRLRWTRSEEFMWAYFRPAGLFEVEAGLDAKGRLTAWDFANYNAGTAALESPYRVANSRTRYYQCDSPLREGSYRGIAATANNFARERFIDELATAAENDPLAFRMANLDNPRMRAVLQAAAEKFRWDPANRLAGLACGTEKGSYVAACVEIDPPTAGAAPKIRRIVMAYECGAILNPAGLRAQVEGSIIQGLGGALTEAITFAGGQLENGSMAKYRVPRFRDVPPIELVLLDRKDLESVGAGETPIIAVAPSIANAVSRATGKHLRAMPVRSA